MQGGREQQRLVHIRGSKALSHGRILSPNSLWKSCHVWCLGGIYSRQTPSMPCYTKGSRTVLTFFEPRDNFRTPRYMGEMPSSFAHTFWRMRYAVPNVTNFSHYGWP